MLGKSVSVLMRSLATASSITLLASAAQADKANDTLAAALYQEIPTLDSNYSTLRESTMLA